MNFPLLDRDAAHRLAATLVGSASLPAAGRGRLDAALVDFLAHALPKRAAVWWGALCAWRVARPAPTEAEDRALRAAVRWVVDPSEANRLAALAPGQEAGMKAPAGCLALAASWSSGSMAPAGLPPVAAPDDATGRLVAGAVTLATVMGDASAFRDLRREFVALGVSVASGRDLWAEGDPLGLLAPRSAAADDPFPDVLNPFLGPIAGAR